MISESGLICPLLLTCLSLTQDHQIKADRRVGGFVFREEVGQIMMERLASINGGTGRGGTGGCPHFIEVTALLNSGKIGTLESLKE